MKIHLPNSAHLRNIEAFLRSFDPSNPEVLKITTDKNWISVHPVAIAMLAALAAKVGTENIVCEEFRAKSGHYFDRIGLFKRLGVKSEKKIEEHEESGRFIPIRQIKTSTEQSKFMGMFP
ncbi:MAG: hypothetical protein Q7S29_00490 [Candidatus Peribacter sp.]|nr:hypothetical protein [Candidatus Peribacter sp.]